MEYSKSSSCNQRGNALFLILIAVALFAALAYVITTSGKGANGSVVATDQAGVIAGEITEQPADVRAAIGKMLIDSPAANITYCGPSAPCNTPNDVFDLADGGGGTANELPPPGGCSPACTVWTYPGFTDLTHGLFVAGVATDAPESLAILPNVTLLVCEAIQKGLSFTTTIPPVQANAALNWAVISNTISQPGGQTGSPTTIYDTGGVLNGQEFACVNNAGASNFYYHVLIAQ